MDMSPIYAQVVKDNMCIPGCSEAPKVMGDKCGDSKVMHEETQTVFLQHTNIHVHMLVFENKFLYSVPPKLHPGQYTIVFVWNTVDRSLQMPDLQFSSVLGGILLL